MYLFIHISNFHYILLDILEDSTFLLRNAIQGRVHPVCDRLPRGSVAGLYASMEKSGRKIRPQKGGHCFGFILFVN